MEIGKSGVPYAELFPCNDSVSGIDRCAMNTISLHRIGLAGAMALLTGLSLSSCDKNSEDTAKQVLGKLAQKAVETVQKPRIPFGGTLETSDDATRRIVQLTNESERTLVVGVTIRKTSTGESNAVSYKSEPGKTERIPLPVGWGIAEAAEVTISHPDFEPYTWRVAPLPPIPEPSTDLCRSWLIGQEFSVKKRLLIDAYWKILDGEILDLKVLNVARNTPHSYTATVWFHGKKKANTAYSDIEVKEGRIRFQDGSAPNTIQFLDFTPISVVATDK
jgi:hypothetical protein